MNGRQARSRDAAGAAALGGLHEPSSQLRASARRVDTTAVRVVGAGGVALLLFFVRLRRGAGGAGFQKAKTPIWLPCARVLVLASPVSCWRR